MLAYGAVPVAGLGVAFFVSGRDAKAAGVDALIAAESLALAGLAGAAVKLAVARRRPGAYESGAAPVEVGNDDRIAIQRVRLQPGGKVGLNHDFPWLANFRNEGRY